jgi:hypothetical protein
MNKRRKNLHAHIYKDVNRSSKGNVFRVDQAKGIYIGASNLYFGTLYGKEEGYNLEVSSFLLIWADVILTSVFPK